MGEVGPVSYTHLKLKKYDAAYKTLTAENAALNKQSAVYKAQER